MTNHFGFSGEGEEITSEFEIVGDLILRNGQQVGYFHAGGIHAGGGPGTHGGRPVGVFMGNGVIHAGNHFDSRQVGYLRGRDLYAGGNGTSGGTLVRFSPSILHAAADLLFT